MQEFKWRTKVFNNHFNESNMHVFLPNYKDECY